MAIAWSMADSELLLSCGKDAKILCSNPNTGEVLYTHCLKKSLFRGGTVAYAKQVLVCFVFLGMMLLWDVSPYPVYLCLVYVPSELVLVVQDFFLVLWIVHVCPYCFSPAK